MTDNVTKQKRSEIMASVKSEGNRSTEITFVRILRNNHITGWRCQPRLFGKPDFVFRRERVAVFIDGCFWHGCPLCYRRPKSSRKYWDAKVHANMARDKRVTNTLRRHGWSVLRIWEHELKQPEKVIPRIEAKLNIRRRMLIDTLTERKGNNDV